MHISVLGDEAIDELKIIKNGLYLDATFGRGGHSLKILNHLGDDGRLFGFDQDEDAVVEGKKITDNRFCIKHMNFCDLKKWCSDKNLIGKIDGILFDLGLSSPQLDDKDRGFSFLKNGPLDMRMNRQQKLTAYQWLQQTDEKDISLVLKKYGEERFSHRIAKNIVNIRREKELKTTDDLVEVIKESMPFLPKNKHPATRSFQAIRIAVNREIEILPNTFKDALEVLKIGGSLVVISFHSLEDRIVKNFFKNDNSNNHSSQNIRYLPVENNVNFKNIKRVKPTEKEIKSNPRARSAILRSGIKI
jgi:16S rRNA (cytosine1402-N4)-methyltransferase